MTRSRRIRTVQGLVLFGITLVFLSGCVSFPAPESDEDTLLIIPIGRDRRVERSWFGRFTLFIADEATDEIVRVVYPSPSDNYVVVDNLPPGRYVVSHDEFRYGEDQRRNTGPSQELNIPFTLESRTATVLGLRFVYIIFQFEEDSRTIVAMNRDWRPVTPDEYDTLVTELQQETNGMLWDYAIGFPR